MTSLSIIDCCRLLTIDSKTLRQWLTQAQMSLHAHPTDARVKCLTGEQVQVLAHLHGRAFQLLSPSGLTPEGASPKPDEAESQVPLSAQASVDLRERLVQMETRLATLQAQVTDLALQLLLEREQRLQAPLTLTDKHALALPALSVPSQSTMPSLACHPTEKRNRLIPLID